MVFADDNCIADFWPSHSESEESERGVEECMATQNERCANDDASSANYSIFFIDLVRMQTFVIVLTVHQHCLCFLDYHFFTSRYNYLRYVGFFVRPSRLSVQLLHSKKLLFSLLQ